MRPDELHPLDRDKVRTLAERLCDLSRGVTVERDELRFLVSQLMACTSPSCSPAGAYAVTLRLLAMADWRLGSEGMAEAALVEIAVEQGCR